MRSISRVFWMCAGSLALGLAGCALDDASLESAGGGGFAGNDQRPDAGANGGGAGAVVPPPEQEAESSFRSPVATSRFIWTANPESGRVALIDAVSLEVRTFQAGFGPTWLAALPSREDPDSNAAIVLNVLGHDATVLRVLPDGAVTTERAPVHADANSWAIGASGRVALAWTDAAKVEHADPTEGFQDVTVLGLGANGVSSTRLSVGYRPTRVTISADERRAFLVTEPGVSVLDLSKSPPAVLDDVIVTDDPVDDPASRDVSITPDGAYALVRLDGSPEVGVVELVSGSRVAVTLSAPVTDLDLSEDGSFALAVARATSEVALLPVPAIFSDPASFESLTLPNQTIGSAALAASGALALLYTNAVASDHLTSLDLRPGDTFLQHRTVGLRAQVSAVFPTPDAAHALALLTPGAGSTRAGAFSVVPLTANLPPKLQGTDAPPFAVALSPAPTTRAVVATRDDAQRIYEAYLARMPELRIDRVPLASAPLAVGMVPAANKAFIAQEYAEGRITFIDLSTGAPYTLTGFELAAKVVDGAR